MRIDRRKFITSSAALGFSGLIGNEAMANSTQNIWVPPEEDKHECTFMQWPVSRSVHSDKYFLEILQQTIADIANTISEFETVIMLADKKYHAGCRKLLSDEITLWNIPTEDLWCRDSGPLFAKLHNGDKVVSHIQFNGWGNKQTHKHDRTVAKAVAKRLGIDVISSGLTGEAGGVEHDGHGLLLAHESSWVNKNRNPGMSRAEIEKRLLKAYGAQRMIWAPGVAGEDITDYHIDSLARFTGPARVLINLPDNPDFEDPFHAAAIKTHAILEQSGLEIDVIPEPVYPRIRDLEFVASYANYYACNGAVIAGQFGDNETDRLALKALKKHFPDREVVTLNVDALGEVGGGIHCATQQMPA